MTRAKLIFITLLFVGLKFVSTNYAQSQEPPVSGLYEICIGVTDPLPQIRYWETLGYRIGPIGELKAEDARALYGVNSKLRSIRMLHQDAEHGLIRLMAWETPVNEGLGLAKLMTPGSRWTSTLTEDVLKLYNHAELAERAGMQIRVVPPQWSQIYNLGKPEPFTGEAIGVRELIVLQPFSRNMFFERFGYAAATYGRVNESAKFKTSQVTHSGLVFQSDDPEVVKFYGDVLGLNLVGVETHQTYEKLDVGSRNLYAMKPGEEYYGTMADNPRSGRTPDTAVSGRLLLRRIPTRVKIENLMERSRPGSLGLSLYTYRVADIEAYNAKVKASKATGVTGVLTNEFGEKSFSFTAPDGHAWTLVGK
ncbi:MAG: VOC family protein [Blastocatellia bacterium]